jgi:hypothetical protein
MGIRTQVPQNIKSVIKRAHSGGGSYCGGSGWGGEHHVSVQRFVHLWRERMRMRSASRVVVKARHIDKASGAYIVLKVRINSTKKVTSIFQAPYVLTSRSYSFRWLSSSVCESLPMSSVLRAGNGSAAGLNTAFSIASMDLLPTIGRTCRQEQ